MAIIFTTPDFKIHQIRGYISNIFLIEYPAGLLLLDGGVVTDIKIVLAYFDEVLKRPIEDLQLIMVSHIHMDHSACAMLLRRKYGIPIAAGHRIDRWYAGFSGYIQYKLDAMMTLFVGLRNQNGIRGVSFKRFLKPDYPIRDTIPLPSFTDWICIEIPGHTTHDLALYNSRHQIMYAGDIIININGKINLPIPIPFRDLMQDTYERLSKMEISQLLMAHGDNLKTKDAASIFQQLITAIAQPLPRIARLAKYLSIYSPEVWRGGLKRRF